MGTRLSESLDRDEIDDERKEPRLKGTDFARMAEKGEGAWKYINRTTEKDRKDAIKGLQKFGEKTGIDETKHIKDLKEARSEWEIQAKIEKMKEAGTKWYRKLLVESGAFDPIDSSESASLDAQLNDLTAWFRGLPLAEGDYNMVDKITNFNKDMEKRIAFRRKLKSQSSFVKKEFIRNKPIRLAELFSEDAVLEEVLAGLGPVQKAPAAVQFEFKKKQSSDTRNDTATIGAEVMEEFEAKKKEYFGSLLGNKEAFGGEEVESKELGQKVPAALADYAKWFTGLENYAEMDAAIKKLPGDLKHRKDLNKKRDDILKDAKPEDKDKLMTLTKGMRRHELVAFLPTLKNSVEKDSVHVAEYVGTMITAKKNAVPLFNDFEKVMRGTSVKKDSAEVQKAKVVVLKAEVEERAQVVDSYFKLDRTLRDDETFLNAHATDRAQMLEDARKRQEKQASGSPFDASDLDSVDGEDITNIVNVIEGGKADEALDDIEKDFEAEGALEALDLQKEVRGRIFGIDKEAQANNDNQLQAARKRAQFWIRDAHRGKVSESDAKAQGKKQHSKWQFMEMWDNANEEGYTLHSGGEVVKRADINMEQLEHGQTEQVQRTLNQKGVKYAEDIMLFDKEGKMVDKTVKQIDKLSKRQFDQVAQAVIARFVREKLGAGAANEAVIRNSDRVEDALRERMFDKEYNYLDQQAA